MYPYLGYTNEIAAQHIEELRRYAARSRKSSTWARPARNRERALGAVRRRIAAAVHPAAAR